MHTPAPKPVHTHTLISSCSQKLECCNNALNWRNAQEKPRDGFPKERDRAGAVGGGAFTPGQSLPGSLECDLHV